jgi:hypothetical protein
MIPAEKSNQLELAQSQSSQTRWKKTIMLIPHWNLDEL